ncbi:hypothetical protein ACJRO7_028419 [Eucalyptus globulus]|uniref:Uncharacterized protein n=1 Tax=Eucalyptus globulus TaxID=34317 RepID=A0ABD3K4B0_EUCGL
MECKNLFCLLTLVFSLLMLEDSMASRIPAAFDPSVNSKIGVVGSTPGKDHGGSVPRPRAKTTVPQAGQPKTSASTVVAAHSKANVNASTAVSPASATLEKQRH